LSSLSLLNHVNPSSYASDPTFLGGRSPPPPLSSRLRPMQSVTGASSVVLTDLRDWVRLHRGV